MNAQEAEAAYRIVKGQLDARQITVDDYNRRVAELRYQDNTGTWWAISPNDGSWLKWNGATWAPAFAHATPAAAPAPAPSPAAQPAQQPAAKPSWYIPPASGVQQKPAATPVAQPAPVAQPVQPSYYIPPVGTQQNVPYQAPAAQPVQQPVQQAATPSYYIPPAGAPQQAPVVQPMYQAPVAQPVAVKQPWSKGKKFAAGSIVCGVVAFILFPLIFAIVAIVLGALSLKEKYKLGAIGIVLGAVAFIIDYFYVIIIH